MTDLLSDEANNYLTRYSSPLSALLKEVEEYTLRHHAHAHMISGSVQGKFLELVSRIIRPQYVLEIGTFTGYSALCLAGGLAPDGELHTIEMREEDAATARRFILRSNYREQIQIYTGNALDILPQLMLPWDLIFIDADKTSYIQYYELTLPHLKPGGVVLADNVLFHGQVLESAIRGKNAKAIHAFNEHVLADERVEQVMLSVRDGISFIRKK